MTKSAGAQDRLLYLSRAEGQPGSAALETLSSPAPLHYSDMVAEDNEHKKVGRCFEIIGEDSGASDEPGQEGTVVHYYIEVLEDGKVALELVDENGDPAGNLIQDILSPEDFNKKYTSCSHHDCPIQPKTIDEIRKKMAESRVVMGEEHLGNGELDAADDKFSRALVLDTGNIRAEFGIGKVRMEQEKVIEAIKIFEKISESNAIYEMANKHMFNEFGIYLRKQEMYDLAIDSYEKSICFDENDPALYFNLSKAYIMKGELLKGIDKVKEALKIKPDFPEAKERLERYLKDEEKMLRKLFHKPEIDED